MFPDFVELELEDSFEHVVSSLTSCLTAFCSLFEPCRRVFFSQLQDSFATVVGLGFVDAAQQYLLDSPLGCRPDQPALFEEVGGIVALRFFSFLVVARHVFLPGWIAILAGVNRQA